MIEMRIFGCKTKEEAYELHGQLVKALGLDDKICRFKPVDEYDSFAICVGEENENDVSLEVEILEH